MYILTGINGQYDDRNVRHIAVSENKEKLERLQAAIEYVATLLEQRRTIRNKYLGENHHRLDEIPMKPLLSKEHLSPTDSEKRAQINKANVLIQRENANKRNDMWQLIHAEAETLCDATIPLTPEQTVLADWVSETYIIDEINVIR